MTKSAGMLRLFSSFLFYFVFVCPRPPIYMDFSFAAVQILGVTDRSISCHMALSAMKYLYISFEYSYHKGV